MTNYGRTIGSLAGAYVTISVADALVRKSKKVGKCKRKRKRK